jgi:hypothetical protein
MVRRAPTLRVVLALLLSLQWGVAFAHCLLPLGLAPLAAAADGHSVEICGAEGIRTLVIGEDGQPRRPAPAAHDSCPLCPGSAAPGPAAPAVASRAIRYLAVDLAPQVAGLPPSPARAPPQQPRAPPIA